MFAGGGDSNQSGRLECSIIAVGGQLSRPEVFCKASLVLSFFGASLLASLPAFAQATPPPSDPPSDPLPAAPPSDAPPVEPAPPPDAAPAPIPAPPTAPATGSAAFEPLPAAESAPTPVAKHPRSVPDDAAVEAPAPAAPPAPSAPMTTSGSALPISDANAADADADGIFGPFRIGVLVGTGVPDVLSLGGAIKLTRYFGAGINVGVIPTIRLSFYGDAKLAYQEYDAYGRIYPFGGSFFLGAGVGYASIRGMITQTYDLSAYSGLGLPKSVSIESRGSVRTLVLTPQIGFQHVFGSGFTIGIDVGAQVPIAPSDAKFSTEPPKKLPEQYVTQYITPNDEKVRSTLDKIGHTVIPTINLKIGWFL